MTVADIIAVTGTAGNRAVLAGEAWVAITIFALHITCTFARAFIGADFYTAVISFPAFRTFTFSFVTGTIIAAFIFA